MQKSAWGDQATQFFHELTPERILDAVERSTGLRCTGRALALNSMENRVYEIEIDLGDDEGPRASRSARPDRYVIAKFYRPGRWSEAQILEEHQFLHDLAEVEIPVVTPRPFLDGKTLHKLADAPIWYAIFPKIGGRSPDELGPEQLAQVGRLLARLHNVGATREAPHRVALDPVTYGVENLRYLLDLRLVPANHADAYKKVVEALIDRMTPLFAGIPTQRVHGDCHLGNLLTGRDGMFFVDFDDMVRGPVVQDIWLLIPGRDEEAQEQIRGMLEAYETWRPFDRRQLALIEPLRALRFVHFNAWIGRRWQDPAFPRAFPHYGTDRYWGEQIEDLREQLELISAAD